MLNQVAVEALHSATYLENYLDFVENLPNDLQRHVSRMKQLDVDCQAILKDLERYQELLEKGPDAISEIDPDGNGIGISGSGGGSGNWQKQLLLKVQTALIQSLEYGDEKVQLVQTVQEEIENKSRQLEANCKSLEFSKDLESADGNKDSSSGRDLGSGNSGGERQPKRPRRNRTDTAGLSERDSPISTPVSTNTNSRKISSASGSGTASGGGKKKTKRRSGRVTEQKEKERSASPPEIPIDPDEPTYCLCDQVSYGEMIGCDNDLCPIEWFHFSCVQLTTKPKGKWYCPRCRGDRPTVMKPKAQFLKELERYNKEKEEKA